MKKEFAAGLFVLLFWMQVPLSQAQQKEAAIAFTATMTQPGSHYFHVTMQYKNTGTAALDFKISAWTPGYYQILDYEKAVENFAAADNNGNKLQWEKREKNDWRVKPNTTGSVLLSYDVKAATAFVANAYVDEHRAYIVPGALFLYLDNALRKPVTVQLDPSGVARHNSHRAGFYPRQKTYFLCRQL